MNAMIRSLHKDEKGAISVKTLLTFVFLAIAVFVLVKFIPVYFQEQSVFHDTDQLAQKASLGFKEYTGDKLQELIERIIKDHDLPADSVTLVSQTGDTAELQVKYTQPIDLFLTTFNWNVDHTSKGKAGL